MDKTCFVMNDCEQLDLTQDQADRLINAGLIYGPDPRQPAYFTTPWNVSLDDVERFLA
jgi:hypothetical protein